MFENLLQFDLKNDRIYGLNREAQAIYIYNRFKKDGSIVFLTSTLYESTLLYQSISNYTDEVLLFPMDDFITSEALAISPELMMRRLETLNELLKNNNKIVITNLMGFLRFLPKKELYQKNVLNLKVNMDFNISELASKLDFLGYEREVIVDRTGQCAIRGFVVDFYPIDSLNPIRLEFFGDTIESIRYFDIDTQKTISVVDEITLSPNTEFITEEEVMDDKYHRDLYKYTEVTNILDYLNDCKIVIQNEDNFFNSYTFLLEEIKQYNAGLGKDDTIYMNPLNISEYIAINNAQSKDSYNVSDVPYLSTSKDVLVSELNNYLASKRVVIIALSSRYLANKLIDINSDYVLTSIDNLFDGKVNIIIKKIESGFLTDKLVVISDKEIFGKRENISYHSNFKIGSKVTDITKINIGDYIVHFNHGIGQYMGIKKIVKNGIEKDYILLKYHGTDKLYVPVEKIDTIKKYSSNESATPKLNKLSSSDWEKTKERIQTKVKDMANELLLLYASREIKKGYAFLPDSALQNDFEEQFEYKATKDQLRVINEIKTDMEKESPMDRLLCGDVGFGKTEVAFRAVFKAIMSNKQVALLCPTTILSFQHYTNAMSRFKNFPVNIAVVNRFVTTKRINEIKRELKEGKIDLLIGTHRLLSDDIVFKDLGLLVIDEEQRFGVKHKEQIKQWKNNIDVLTLTATPIPRTLQMTFAGIRSLSLIETAPSNRYPVQTYVIAKNNQLIKDAIYKEISRDGQVFILYNKVMDMKVIYHEIQTLAPDLRIACAHGQMDKKELEKVMIDFTNHEYDILICTTIIETGIDIPRVNTLIIMEADKFGLSQLYQIRGRVGRSDKIAYCYLMYDNFKGISDIASKRLGIIKEFTKLGSGFSIAMRDLAIRGAGDILGSDQAGFVDSVGVELFLSMLENEVKKLKGEVVAEVSNDTDQPLLDVSTSISDNYVSDEELKVEIHKMINSIDSMDKLNKVKEELEDRFGKISDNMDIYMHNELFEHIANSLDIKNIKQNRNYVEIIVPEFVFEKIKIDDLFIESQRISRMFRFTTRGRYLVIVLDTVKLEKHFVYYMLELFLYIKNVIDN